MRPTTRYYHPPYSQAALRHPSILALDKSPFLRGKLIVGVAEHVYICGRQHMQAKHATFRACDTGVFWVQSAEAARRWPVTPAKRDELLSAFRATNG